MDKYTATEQAYKNGYAKGYADAKKDSTRTNADRIRAMSDEQLADYWANHYDNFCQKKPECGALLDADEGIPEEMCVACALAWLQRPAEEVQK